MNAFFAISAVGVALMDIHEIARLYGRIVHR
jgi:hypothetical protein